MDGLRISRTAKGVNVLIIDHVSPQLKTELKERLSELCWGIEQARSLPEFFSLSNTLKEFFKRFDSKNDATQLGIAGELVVHAVVPHILPELNPTSMLFNKEERSIKKGFDFVFYEPTNNEIWYGEAKSGRWSDRFTDSNEKARDLMTTSINGLSEMFAKREFSRWTAAQYDASLVLSDSCELDRVRKLLMMDWNTSESKSSLPKGVFAAVVVNPRSHSEIDDTSSDKITDGIESLASFSDFRAIVIQQDELETVITYLRELRDAA